MRRGVLLALWGAGVVAVVAAGFQDDAYLVSVRGIPAPHPVPATGVAAAIGLVTVETAALGMWLGWRPLVLPFTRRAVAAVLASALAALAVTASLHAPPFIIAAIWWTIAVAAVVLADAVRVGVQALRRRAGREPV